MPSAAHASLTALTGASPPARDSRCPASLPRDGCGRRHGHGERRRDQRRGRHWRTGGEDREDVARDSRPHPGGPDGSHGRGLCVDFHANVAATLPKHCVIRSRRTNRLHSLARTKLSSPRHRNAHWISREREPKASHGPYPCPRFATHARRTCSRRAHPVLTPVSPLRATGQVSRSPSKPPRKGDRTGSVMST